MTEAEYHLWYFLRNRRFDGEKFRRQQPIGNYVVDFVHYGARLIVEADGGQHNDSIRDAVRDAWLRTQRFDMLRFWNDDILGKTESVLDAIHQAVLEARNK
jgi:very-short-patch-repair endonuclease